MKPASRKLRSSTRAEEPVGDREHVFLSMAFAYACRGTQAASWYWTFEGELIPTGRFRAERDAGVTPCGPRPPANELIGDRLAGGHGWMQHPAS